MVEYPVRWIDRTCIKVSFMGICVFYQIFLALYRQLVT